MKRSRILMTLIGAAIGAVAGALVATGALRTDEFESKMRRAIPAILLWVAFFVYWSIAARNAGATKSGESKGSTATHQILLNAALLLLVLPIPGLTMQLLPSTMTFTIAGAALQVAFIGLAVWARVHLGRNWAAEVRIAEGHELVKSGPYRSIRHPIYTAMLGMFAATAVETGQLHSVLAVGMLVILYLRKTRLEENILHETFGVNWEHYRRDTWALVPLVY